MKRNLLICAAQYVHVDGGYLSRIQSEIDKINKDFNVYMYIPSGPTRDGAFGNDVNVLCYPYKTGKGIITYLKNVVSCKSHFKKIITTIENPIIYCEALVGSMWILDIARKKGLQVVFDCHGTEADEILMCSRSIKHRAYAVVLKHYEKIAVDISSLIITVTNKQYQKWNIDKKYVKYPMVPSPQFFDAYNYRKDIRKKLNIENDATVYVYSGGAAMWQMCNETIELYKRIEERDSKSLLLILTGRTDVFNELIKKYNIKNSRLLTVKYDDVPKYLDAADYGFCIRANHIVNNVASPTKILEYLARNVKPVITNCIGDFSDELGNLNLACIMNENLDNLEDIKISPDFDGCEYVKRVKNDCVEKYTTAIKEL